MLHRDPPPFELITDLSQLWHALRAQRLFVSEVSCEHGRCFATVGPNPGLAGPRTVRIALLERIFEGESQKALAYELGVSVATIASYTANALHSVVAGYQVSRAPLLVVMAALAAKGTPLDPAKLEEVRPDGSYRISVDVPSGVWNDRLSSGEREVARLAIEGGTYSEIAQRRGTSSRTVANQLQSTFQKLGYSGRAALRAQAVREHAEARLREREASRRHSTIPPFNLPRAVSWPEPELAAYA